MNSDEALECHPGVPQNVYFWHFEDANDMAEALTDLNTELGALTPVDGDCHLLWNGPRGLITTAETRPANTAALKMVLAIFHCSTKEGNSSLGPMRTA